MLCICRQLAGRPNESPEDIIHHTRNILSRLLGVTYLEVPVDEQLRELISLPVEAMATRLGLGVTAMQVDIYYEDYLKGSLYDDRAARPDHPGGSGTEPSSLRSKLEFDPDTARLPLATRESRFLGCPVPRDGVTGELKLLEAHIPDRRKITRLVDSSMRQAGDGGSPYSRQAAASELLVGLLGAAVANMKASRWEEEVEAFGALSTARQVDQLCHGATAEQVERYHDLVFPVPAEPGWATPRSSLFAPSKSEPMLRLTAAAERIGIQAPAANAEAVLQGLGSSPLGIQQHVHGPHPTTVSTTTVGGEDHPLPSPPCLPVVDKERIKRQMKAAQEAAQEAEREFHEAEEERGRQQRLIGTLSPGSPLQKVSRNLLIRQAGDSNLSIYGNN